MGKIVNTPLTDTAAILNLFDLRSIMGCPAGHEHDSIYSHQYLLALFGPILLYVFLEKDYNGKKKEIVVPCLGVIMIAFFSTEKYTVKFSFFPEKRA